MKRRHFITLLGAGTRSAAARESFAHLTAKPIDPFVWMESPSSETKQ